MSNIYKAIEFYLKAGIKYVPVKIEVIDGKKKCEMSNWRNKDFHLEDFRKNHNSIGLKTGKISNIMVIDIDVTDGKDGFKTLEDFGINIDEYDIPQVKSQSGGRHIYFQYSEKLLEAVREKTGEESRSLTTAKPEKGIDLRGNGGLIFAPPSKPDGGDEYQWLIKPSTTEVAFPEIPQIFYDFILSLFDPAEKANERKEIIDCFDNLEMTNSEKKAWETSVRKFLTGYAKPHRSGKDFNLACAGIELGVSEQSIINELMNAPTSKLKEQGKNKDRYIQSLFKKAKSKTNRKSDYRSKNYNNSYAKTSSIPLAPIDKDKPRVGCNSINIDPNAPRFWNISKIKKKVVVSLNKVRWISFLEHFGFAKYWIDEDNCCWVRVINNIVYRLPIMKIKDFVTRYVMQIPESYMTKDFVDKDGIVEEYQADNEQILTILMSRDVFSENMLGFLPSVEIDFLRDGPKIARLFYENGFIEIKKDSLLFKDYKDLPHNIWKEQIQKRKINKVQFEKYKNLDEAEFSEFCKLLSNKNPFRFLSMRTALGYLLHTYKNPAQTKAIIFLDEKLSKEGDANGRTGKSLMGVALSKCRKVTTLDGQTFDFKDNFRFQDVAIDTDIINFNDASKKFDFTKLFSSITNEFRYEKKQKDSIIQDYEHSPKFLLSTNFVIKGLDDSSSARQSSIEIHPEFSEKNPPIAKFKHLFFNDWDSLEWLKFDIFMAQNLKLFLQKGITDYNKINLKEKNLIASTSEEFVAAMESAISELKIYPYEWDLDVAMEKKDEYFNSLQETMQRIKEHTTFEKIGPITLNRYFKIWAEVRDYVIVEKIVKVYSSQRLQNIATRGFFMYKKIVNVEENELI